MLSRESCQRASLWRHGGVNIECDSVELRRLRDIIARAVRAHILDSEESKDPTMHPQCGVRVYSGALVRGLYKP